MNTAEDAKDAEDLRIYKKLCVLRVLCGVHLVLKGIALRRISKLAAVVLTALTVSAQTPVHKPTQAVRPNTNAPTKVTGDGVKTSTGLQYWDIKVGTGDVATAGSRVKVHYTGWLDTGKKFDSTVDAHQPYSFNLGKSEVIKGWDEGIEGMKVGGKRQLRIPPELAYGEDGHLPQVPPNSTLVFDVQLIAVK